MTKIVDGIKLLGRGNYFLEHRKFVNQTDSL